MEAEFNYQFTVEKIKVGGTRSRRYELEPSEDVDTKPFGSVSSSEWCWPLVCTILTEKSASLFCIGEEFSGRDEDILSTRRLTYLVTHQDLIVWICQRILHTNNHTLVK